MNNFEGQMLQMFHMEPKTRLKTLLRRTVGGRVEPVKRGCGMNHRLMNRIRFDLLLQYVSFELCFGAIKRNVEPRGMIHISRTSDGTRTVRKRSSIVSNDENRQRARDTL